MKHGPLPGAGSDTGAARDVAIHPKRLKWGNILFLCVNVAIFLNQCLVTQYHAVFIFEKDKSFWTQFPWGIAAAVLTSSATLFGGWVALKSLLTNSNQQQAQFVERQETERQRFIQQQLMTEFSDILNRLSDSGNILMRANAATRLAEFATRLSPFGKQPYVTETYPFFARSASHLSSVLHLEGDQSVRNEAKRALQELISFAKSSSPSLSALIITSLADVNRHASRKFTEAVAEYCCLYTEENAPERAVELVDVILLNPTDLIDHALKETFLRDLSASNTFAAMLRVRKTMKRPPERAGEDATISFSGEAGATLRTVWETSEHLSDTIEALRSALDALPPLEELPADSQSLKDWKPPFRINLSGCLLPGADLEGAQLARADFSNAYMHGVNLMGAILLGADFQGSVMKGAHLANANLQASNLNKSKLDKAKMQGSRLEGAELIGASLTGTYLQGVIVSMLETMPYGRTNFLDSNWNEASRLSWADDGGVQLRNWLSERHPEH